MAVATRAQLAAQPVQLQSFLCQPASSSVSGRRSFFSSVGMTRWHLNQSHAHTHRIESPRSQSIDCRSVDLPMDMHDVSSAHACQRMEPRHQAWGLPGFYIEAQIRARGPVGNRESALEIWRARFCSSSGRSGESRTLMGSFLHVWSGIRGCIWSSAAHSPSGPFHVYKR